MKVDNFTLEQFVCPAKYDLRINKQIVPIRRKPSLNFGGVIHSGLAEWYRTGSEAKALKIIHSHWPEVMPSDDFRDEAYALKVMHKYCQEYPTETWSVLQGTDGAVVEQAFTASTGMFLECQNPDCDSFGRYGDPDDAHIGKCDTCGQDLEAIDYGGIIDIGSEFGDMLYVVDHKTTTRLGDGNFYFQAYKPDNQMSGYIWGLSKVTNRRVGGAIVNAIGLYKSGEVKFKRRITTRNQFELDEWLVGVRVRCNEIKRCERSGIWRLETSKCQDWGGCEYRDIHILGDATSRQARTEQDYVKSEWNYENRDD